MAVLTLLILTFTGWELGLSRQSQVERAETTTQNLAQVLEQNVSGTFRQIDLTLLAICDEAGRVPAGPRDPGLAPFIRVHLGRLPVLESIRVLDAEGASLQGPPPDVDPAAVRAFVQGLRDRPRPGLAVSAPLRHGPPGTWGLILARRIEGPDGRFLGAACADLPIDRLSRAMAIVNVGQHGTVSLRGENLALLVRVPATRESDRLTGDTRISGDYRAAVQSSRELTHFTSDSVLDGERRTYTLKAFGHPRFYILVGLAQSDYLQGWRRQAWVTGLGAATIVGLVLTMGWMTRAAWLRQLEDRERLSVQEARFRLLADNALDVVWSLDPSGALTYISPSIEKQRG